MDRLGIRQLRAQVAAAVRRASLGERIVITVGGRPVAQLGPLEAPEDRPTLEALAARGLVTLPRRTDRPPTGLEVPLWPGARIDRLLREVRGVTVALDTTALLARHLLGPWQEVVGAALAADPDWCASALAVTEALSVVDRLTDDPADREALRAALRADAERLALVPVDPVCLERAAQLARDHPLRTVDALHLAAADRLPRPVTYLTFDPHQMPVAEALGFAVASS